MDKKNSLSEAYLKPSRSEVVLEGIGVSHGIAIGAAYLVQVDHPKAPKRDLETHHIEAEVKRFQDAVAEAINDLEDLKQKSLNLPETAAEEVQLLLVAHLAMLSGSRLIKGAELVIREQHVNAEFALEKEIEKLAAQFEAMEDRYLAARIDDIQAVGTRLLRILMDLPYLSLDAVPQGGIVLAKEITPADTVLLDPRKFAGMATMHGGAAGHTAVMARSLGLPAVLGVSNLFKLAHHDGLVIIDGIAGKIIINPSKTTLANYQEKLDGLKQEQNNLEKIRTLPSETRDGVKIALRANLEMPRDLETAKHVNADGIGLFRTEFMFMNRSTLPTEDEQFEILSEVVKASNSQGVTFRTLDIGGDKLVKAMGDRIADCDNPALGLRAIRLSLKVPQLLKTQFRAILRAAYFDENVRILLPMITTAAEVRQVRKILNETEKELKHEGVRIAEKTPPLGVMIEIPAAALAADSLAAVSDFFALGTNDLIQYTVAIDRGNDQVAALYDPLNPAVLRLIEFSIQAGLRARIPVSICGEMAADPCYTGLLLGLGIREMSVGPAGLPLIKKRIRDVDLVTASRHAQLVMDQYDSGRIITLVNDFNQDM